MGTLDAIRLGTSCTRMANSTKSNSTREGLEEYLSQAQDNYNLENLLQTAKRTHPKPIPQM